MIYKTKIKKIFAGLASLFLISLFCAPVFAQTTQTVPANGLGTGITYECGSGTTAGDCTFADFVAATQNVVVFLRNLALMFSVVVIAYAGAKYMISGDSAKAKS